MVVHVSGAPATPSSPDGKDFRDYIASIHPRYDWRECLDVLVDISLYRSTSNEDPRTSTLTTNLNMTRARLMGRVEAMEPQYVRILRSRVIVVIGVSEYRNPIKQRIEFDKILHELEDFLRSTAPSIVDPELLRTLWSLYHGILDLMTRYLLYWAVKIYHGLIGMLTSSGIHHGLQDAHVQVNRRTARKVFIVIGVFCFDRKTQEDELEKLLRELEDFLRSTAPEIVDPALLGTLWSRYNDIVSLVRRGDLFGAVSTYRNLIQLLNASGIHHGLRDANVQVDRRTAREIFIVIEEFCFDRKTQEDELEKLLRELEDFLRSTAPEIVDPALLGTLWSRYNDIVSLVRRGDLFRAVSTYRNLIELLIGSGIRHNLRYAYVRSTAYRYRLTPQGEIIFNRWKLSTI